ncbi:MAG: M15 family metallopeptidase [Lachnospiraceae bacterium]|nr:M15 family metallopeptidase [Lachnospiraceae bacterium]
MVTPANASGWKFKPAKEKNAPWNSVSANFAALKTASEKAVSDSKVSENRETDKKVSDNKTEDKKVSENKAEKKNVKRKVSADDWRLILVNKQNPIPDDYEAVMVPVSGGITIREEVAGPLMEMFEAAAKEGVTLTVCSGYRSHEHQQNLFDRKIRNYTGSGLSYLDAFRIGSYSVIIPGTSEHELGMAADIVTPGYSTLNEGFANTEAGRWLKNNAFKYGFILRYPKGKEYITGITYEPWHFRYVGKEAAIDIKNADITLEEYIDELELY